MVDLTFQGCYIEYPAHWGSKVQPAEVSCELPKGGRGSFKCNGVVYTVSSSLCFCCDRFAISPLAAGDIPFQTSLWTKQIPAVTSWEDWFSMQEGLDEKLLSIVTGRYMNILWANAGKPKPEEAELLESVRRVTTDFVSRPATIGLGLSAFRLDPYARPLTVHVVGASHVETLNARVTDYDELSRLFPKHQGIEVVMVGVDVVDGAVMRPPLVAFGPRGRVYLSSYKGLYHDFWESRVETQQAARPDVVVVFHPGRWFHCSFLKGDIFSNIYTWLSCPLSTIFL